jgi:hypothetical protein
MTSPPSLAAGPNVWYMRCGRNAGGACLDLHVLTSVRHCAWCHVNAGPNVWHERWGEDYDAGGDACVKWTDKWAERLLPGGAREQWGDKWHEAFANGRGEKNGEVRLWGGVQ